jgi:hypothetical protein
MEKDLRMRLGCFCFGPNPRIYVLHRSMDADLIKISCYEMSLISNPPQNTKKCPGLFFMCLGKLAKFCQLDRALKEIYGKKINVTEPSYNSFDQGQYLIFSKLYLLIVLNRSATR